MYKRLTKINAILLFTLFVSILTSSALLFADDDDDGDIPKLTIEGLQKKIAENKDKVIIVDFWATWCPPCKDEIPGFISLYKKYRSKGLLVLGVAVDEGGNRTVKPFARMMKINYPLFLGGFEFHGEYDIYGLPTTLIFGKEGVLKFKHVGFASKKEFETEILTLLD